MLDTLRPYQGGFIFRYKDKACGISDLKANDCVCIASFFAASFEMELTGCTRFVVTSERITFTVPHLVPVFTNDKGLKKAFDLTPIFDNLPDLPKKLLITDYIKGEQAGETMIFLDFKRGELYTKLEQTREYFNTPSKVFANDILEVEKEFFSIPHTVEEITTELNAIRYPGKGLNFLK